MKDFKNYLSGNAFTLTEGRQAWQTKSALTHGVTAKEVRSTVKNTLAPCGRGQNLLANECELRNSGEGSGKSNMTETTPHQVRTKLARRSLSPTILSRKGRGMRAAFTLAEVLITLAVIGVVAVLTIPGLIKNHNEKAWSTAQDVFTKRLEVATRQMNTEEKLAGYDNTMDFVNELKKYIKITRVCDNNEITKCFNKQVIWNEGDEPVDMSAIKNAQNFGLDWESDTDSLQME